VEKKFMNRIMKTSEINMVGFCSLQKHLSHHLFSVYSVTSVVL